MDTKSFVTRYVDEFTSLPASFEATDSVGNSISFADGISKSVQHVLKAQKGNKKVIIVGNGGSASIASHLAVDFWKNGNVKATAFNDSSLLTCLANDYSYQEVFSKPIEFFGEADDVVLTISSSGNSANILKAAEAGVARGCKVITFSGFGKDNKLRAKGDVNFYVPSFSYGYVEVLHTYIIHCILDAKMYLHDKVDIFNKNLPI